MNRRDFIQASALAASSITLSSFLMNKTERKIGLQLYSLRDVIKKDVTGTMTQIASFGYKEIETYDYSKGKFFGLSVLDFGKMANDLGMKITSGHYGTELFDQWEQVVSDAKSIGQKYMVVPSLSDQQRGSLDSLRKVCEAINKNAEVCKKYGIRMGYHNHAAEFKEVEGQLIYDVLLKELDPKLVAMELDLYWVVFANQDPLRWFAALPGRFEQWHVKDMSKTDSKLNADIGTGSIDFKPIFAKAKESGMKHFYVEQETYLISPIESIKASAQNMKSMLAL